MALSPVKTEVGPLRISVKLLVTTMMAATFLEGSATLVAVRITLAGEGKICGVLRRPLGLTVPHVIPEHPGPLSVQSTLLLGCPAEATLA